MKVIIVEDEVPAAEKLERYLQKYDSAMQVVNRFDSIAETVEWLRKNQDTIDLIFMDMQMPELDGIEATIEIRKRCAHQPKIVATANALAEERLKCIDAGMDSYMSKLFKTEDLMVILKEITEVTRTK